MSSSARYVIDSNVIISALLLADSKPGRAFREALGHGQILVSLPLLEENPFRGITLLTVDAFLVRVGR